MKTIKELQDAVSTALIKAGAPPDVRWEVDGMAYKLRTTLSKFNLFAYVEGEPSSTTLSLGEVQKKADGSAFLPVFAQANELRVLMYKFVLAARPN